MKKTMVIIMLIWALVSAAAVSADEWDDWDAWLNNQVDDYAGYEQTDVWQEPAQSGWTEYDPYADAEWDAWLQPTDDSYEYTWDGDSYTIFPQVSSDYIPPQTDYSGIGDWNSSDWNSARWFYQDDSWSMPGGDDFFDDWFDDWFGYGNLPSSAAVSGFTGYAQSYTLDCETRSAVDLAAYFGVNISHSEFLNSLPKSDDPNLGFVGSYTGARGQIPPASYGVYQGPVAQLLREYGLNAVGVLGFTDEALKAQIAAGRPVMVWVAGNTEVGHSVPYTPSNGRTTTVVPYQHTVVVIGYDANGVTIQDGAMRYTRSWGTFDASWGTLDYRAIYVK